MRFASKYDYPAGKQLGRKRPRGPGGYQVEYAPAMCL